ncbi:MAG: hypothetical protein NTX03_03260 [Bacteroidetes bacterium]|nr:hypothetical protein [Bacteroidota bacterium]
MHKNSKSFSQIPSTEMTNKAAIIDLGTNTFHMLVFSWEGRQFTVIDKLQIPVKLGKGAFEEMWIQPEAYRRGIEEAHRFREILDREKIEIVRAFGTATLRETANAAIFQKEVEEMLGTSVNIIDGDAEADMIYQGVKFAVPMGQEAHLIMDIGGGSVEFIIGNESEIFWKKSFNIGVARLNDKFYKADPIDGEHKELLHQYLEKELEEVWEKATEYNITTLVGASGTFESLSDVSMNMFHSIPQTYPFVNHIMDISNFNEIGEKIVASTKTELSNMAGLIAFRIEMIVVGVIMVQHVIERLKIQKLIVSDYALKEGIMMQMIEEEIRKAV